jgi:hypothetical protein
VLKRLQGDVCEGHSEGTPINLQSFPTAVQGGAPSYVGGFKHHEIGNEQST